MIPSIQHWLIFGDSGAGKSTGAATFPRPQLVLLKEEAVFAGRNCPPVVASNTNAVADTLDV